METELVKVKMPDGNTAEVRVIDAVAANYYDTAQQIKDETIRDPQEAIDHTKDRNHAILGDSPGKWPALFTSLGKQASDLHVDGTIRNIDDWAVVLEEIYKGLKLAGEK